MRKANIILGSPVNKPLTISRKNEEIYIGVDRGALYLIEMGIQPDLAIGDFDSIDHSEMSRIERESKQVEKFKSEKNDTDTELALVYTKKNFQPSLYEFYNWYGGRLDHFMSILFLAHQPRFQSIIDQVVFKDENNTLTFYLPGQHSVKREKSKNYLSFIGMTSINDLTLNNVKYTLDKATFSYPQALISNEFIDDEAIFSFSEGLMAVVQSND